MPILKPYRPPRLSLLLIVLLFGLLMLLCWHWYEKQLENLDKHLDELQHKATGSVMDKKPEGPITAYNNPLLTLTKLLTTLEK